MMSNLETIRKSKKLTRRELALLSGVKEITIRYYESGILDLSKAKLCVLISLAKALKVKVVDIVDKDLIRYIR